MISIALKMSNTLRFFNNNARVSTAVQFQDKQAVLQVYPERKWFTTKDEWQTTWDQQSLPKLEEIISPTLQDGCQGIVRLHNEEGTRVATGILRKKGKIIQVFPRPFRKDLLHFKSLDAWKTHCVNQIKNTRVEEKAYEAKPKQENPKANANTISSSTQKTTKKAPTCPMCHDPVPAPRGCIAGGDGSHRMCLVRGFRAGIFSSVNEWSDMCRR